MVMSHYPYITAEETWLLIEVRVAGKGILNSLRSLPFFWVIL